MTNPFRKPGTPCPTCGHIEEDPTANKLGPFSRDSSTSRKAALDNFPRSGTQRDRVLNAIMNHPRTRDELAGDLHLGDSSVDARVWELKQGGFVRDTDRTRKTQQGSDATVLEATDKAFKSRHGGSAL